MQSATKDGVGRRGWLMIKLSCRPSHGPSLGPDRQLALLALSHARKTHWNFGGMTRWNIRPTRISLSFCLSRKRMTGSWGWLLQLREKGWWDFPRGTPWDFLRKSRKISRSKRSKRQFGARPLATASMPWRWHVWSISGFGPQRWGQIRLEPKRSSDSGTWKWRRRSMVILEGCWCQKALGNPSLKGSWKRRRIWWAGRTRAGMLSGWDCVGSLRLAKSFQMCLVWGWSISTCVGANSGGPTFGWTWELSTGPTQYDAPVSIRGGGCGRLGKPTGGHEKNISICSNCGQCWGAWSGAAEVLHSIAAGSCTCQTPRSCWQFWQKDDHPPDV